MAAKLLIFGLQAMLWGEGELFCDLRIRTIRNRTDFGAILVSFAFFVSCPTSKNSQLSTGRKNDQTTQRMLQRKKLTPEQALQKLKHYCGYQERCHREVNEKLFSLGIKKNERDAIIATLIEENYLNEERFAIAFARGKFRMNQWGKIKIRNELKKRGVSDYCISKALKQIGDKEYLQTLKKLSQKYYASLKEERDIFRQKKTRDYLMMKGFEGEVVWSIF